MIERKKVANKSQIIAEYLTTDQTYKGLSAKHGVNATTIQTWVRAYRTKNGPELGEPANSVQDDGHEFKKQLEQAKMKIVFLEEVLSLAKEQTGIDFLKKNGARRS